jgi:hypothetical protein
VRAKVSALWYVSSCRLVETDRKYRDIAVKMGVVSTSETSDGFYETTRRNVPEYSRVHTFRHENLKSHFNVRMIMAQNVVVAYFMVYCLVICLQDLRKTTKSSRC